MMGYLITHPDLQPINDFALLVAASCMLYLSGMVLNDVFDSESDARDRPDRPIPSGRVSLRAATAAGWGLLAGGVLIAWFVSVQDNDWRPGAIATLLAACILLYDGALKRTRLAPIVMGECRTLNVLLGMSLMIIPWGEAEVLIAIGIGVYIMGVTIFARTDARISSCSAPHQRFCRFALRHGVIVRRPAAHRRTPTAGRDSERLVFAVGGSRADHSPPLCDGDLRAVAAAGAIGRASLRSFRHRARRRRMRGLRQPVLGFRRTLTVVSHNAPDDVAKRNVKFD